MGLSKSKYEVKVKKNASITHKCSRCESSVYHSAQTPYAIASCNGYCLCESCNENIAR